MALVLGEITGGAIGTISYVDGDRLYGFGHPMDQFGSVQLPIIEARVLGEVSNLAAPYKFATLNPTVRGTLTQDRMPGVRGVLGDGPELVPVRSVLALPSGAVELVHEVATGVEQAGLVSLAAFTPLSQRVDNEADHSLRVAVEVSFVETDSMLDRSRLFAEPEDRLYSLIAKADADLTDALQQHLHRDDYTCRCGRPRTASRFFPSLDSPRSRASPPTPSSRRGTCSRSRPRCAWGGGTTGRSTLT